MSAETLLGLLDLDADPEQPAVIHDGTTISRGTVLARARERADLVARSVPEGWRVGLEDSQDAETVVNVVAALVAGRSIAMLPQEGGIDLADAAARGCAAILHGAQLEPVGPAAGARPVLDTRTGQQQVGSPETVVLFTSGTTSEPRGVRLSERNVATNLTAMLRLTPDWDRSDRFGMVLAITHSFGLSMVLLSLARRVPIVMLGGGLPSRRVVEQFDAHEVSVLACVPYYLRLLQRRSLTLCEDVGRHLHTMYLAGGGVTDDDLRRLVPGFRGDQFLMYGFTESTARVAVRRVGDGAPSGSVGLPLPGTFVEIVTPGGTPVPPGAEGRIRVTSPSLMMGYLGGEVRTPGTPFTTTDLGHLDAAGNLFVTGREAEMLNFRGNRVSVVSVEATVVKLDGVLDARLVPDVRDEDAQCTLFVIAEPSADQRRIRREALRIVTPRGILREVVFTDHLETTRSGKPLRRR